MARGELYKISNGWCLDKILSANKKYYHDDSEVYEGIYIDKRLKHFESLAALTKYYRKRISERLDADKKIVSFVATPHRQTADGLIRVTISYTIE